MVFAATPLRAQSYTDLRDFDCSTGCTPYDGAADAGCRWIPLWNDRLRRYGEQRNNFQGQHRRNVIHVVWNFDGTNSGELPTAALTLATDGNFYGTTAGGGTSNYGTLFSFNPKTLALNVLHDFSSAESSSDAPPSRPRTRFFTAFFTAPRSPARSTLSSQDADLPAAAIQDTR